MSKPKKLQSNAWKIIVGLSAVVGLIASLLQIFGAVDFWNLLFTPLYNLLVSSVPAYQVVLIIVAVSILSLAVLRFKRHRSNILDLEDARRIALLCQTPQTTEYLRQQYDYWQSQSHVVVIGGYNFDDYIKQLENQGYLKYQNGKWEATQKALDYIKKYHGNLL
jgi:hypothetical protein